MSIEPPKTTAGMIKWMLEDLAFIIKNHYVPDRTIQLGKEYYGIDIGERVDKRLAQQELRQQIIYLKGKEKEKEND